MLPKHVNEHSARNLKKGKKDDNRAFLEDFPDRRGAWLMIQLAFVTSRELKFKWNLKRLHRILMWSDVDVSFFYAFALCFTTAMKANDAKLEYLDGLKSVRPAFFSLSRLLLPFHFDFAWLQPNTAIKFIAFIFEGESLKLEIYYQAVQGPRDLQAFAFFLSQARRRWNTKRANGTRSASAVASARRRSERNLLFRASRTSTVPDATKISSPRVAWSAER